jgi:hypothetical protein
MTQKIEAIQSNIIFKFTENVTQGRFINKAASGILVNSGDDNQTLYPRWGKALFVGHDVREVDEGNYILIEKGMWTPGFFVGDERYWKTAEDKVICVADEPGSTY